MLSNMHQFRCSIPGTTMQDSITSSSSYYLLHYHCMAISSLPSTNMLTICIHSRKLWWNRGNVTSGSAIQESLHAISLHSMVHSMLELGSLDSLVISLIIRFSQHGSYHMELMNVEQIFLVEECLVGITCGA